MNLGHHIIDTTIDGKAEVRRLVTALESIKEDYADSYSHPTVFNDAVALIDRLRQESPEQREAIYAAGELLKQLALAEDVPQEVADKINVSQEGLGEFITKIKSMFSSGTGKPDPGKYKGKKLTEFIGDVKAFDKEFEKRLGVFEQAIKKFFANDTWLGQQTFITGKISGDGICQSLSIGGKFDGNFEKAIAEGFHRYTKLDGYRRECVAYGDKLAQIDDKLCKATAHFKVGDEADEAKVDELVRAEIKVIRALPKPSVKGLPKQYMGGDQLESVESQRFGEHCKVTLGVDKVENIELDALDHAGVKKAAQLLLESIKFFRTHGLDSDWYMKGSTEDDGENLREFYDSVMAVDTYYDVTHWQTLVELYDAEELFDRLVDVLSALERWINRSIK